MPQQLKALPQGAPVPNGQQNVVIVNGQNTTGNIQAPTNGGSIWFAFGIGQGNATLNVTFNGANYPNVPPGSYQLSGLTTSLSLDVTVSGSAKLAWINS